MNHKDFLTLSETPPDTLQSIFETAIECKRKRLLSHKTGERLAGRSVALIFEKPSTRTRCSINVGVFEEGGQAHSLNAGEFHSGAKEDLRDTARVLGQYYSAIAWRGHGHDRLLQLAKDSPIPVINMLSNDHHPTQALADALTLHQEFGRLAGLKVVYYGDVCNNVARSLCEAGAHFGFSVVLSGPEHLLHDPSTPRGNGVTHCADPVTAAQGAHALYTDVWTSMGDAKANETKEWETYGRYQVTRDLMVATGRDDSIFLHCLPAVREREVTNDVIESERSRVFQQAENRLHTIKATLIHTINAYRAPANR
jgi:ornithine carbamoyltransferase